MKGVAMRDWSKWTQADKKAYRDARKDVIGMGCTLDGHQAIVRFNMATGWPSVCRLDTFQRVGFSFTTIYNIMENHGGRFRS